MSITTWTRRTPLWLLRTLRITLFAVGLLVCTQIRIPVPGTPVPITLQTLWVLLMGMALGPREAAVSVVAYWGLIAAGADGRGVAAFSSPTAGYLLGFLPGAVIAGLAWRAPQRWKFALSLLCGFLGVVAVFALGVTGLFLLTGDWWTAFMRGAIPFIVVDFGKVLLAASLVKLGQESWLRWFAGR
jgi:biotin transport system substrate-specific component